LPAEAKLSASAGGATGVKVVHGALADELSGPIEAERAFALAFAAEPKNWRLVADCRLR